MEREKFGDIWFVFGIWEFEKIFGKMMMRNALKLK
jgi:hypothetical protein